MDEADEKRFYAKDARGEIVGSVEGLSVAFLELHLLKRDRGTPAGSAFIEQVIGAASTIRSASDTAAERTPAERRDALLAIERAAHATQAALHPLAHGSDLFDLVASHDSYRRIVATREGSRSSSATSLSELLQHVDRDLSELRAICEYVGERISPSRASPKDSERVLADQIVGAHIRAFGCLPPIRGWFASFVQEVGMAIGLSVGHKVVGEAVKRAGV